MSAAVTHPEATWTRLVLSAVAMLASFAIMEKMPEANVLVYGLGYAHYALGLKYSRRGVNSAWERPRAKALLLGAFATSFLLAGIPMVVTGIIVYFGIHHAISEAYFQTDSPRVRTAHGAVVIGTYLSIISSNLSFIPHLMEAGWVVTILAALALIVAVKSESGKLDWSLMLRRFPWLTIGPAFLILAFWLPVDWRALTLFHFIFWGALPALRPGLIKGRALKTYWTETALINAGCVALVLGLNLFGKNTSNQLPYFAMTQLFFAWSYLHITWSFIVSGANPPWVKRLVGVAR